VSSWKFSSEWKPTIPLPPEYTFPQAFNYLNPQTNSFYILESPTGDYIQCGGSKERCTVEVRRFHDGGHTHYVLGRPGEPDRLTKIEMSNGGVQVRESEVFRHWDAIELFKRFFEGQDFPEDITLREVKL
jgi:hypothetical protein